MGWAFYAIPDFYAWKPMRSKQREWRRLRGQCVVIVMSNICDLPNKPGSTYYLLVPFCIVNLIDNVSSGTFLGISSK